MRRMPAEFLVPELLRPPYGTELRVQVHRHTQLLSRPLGRRGLPSGSQGGSHRACIAVLDQPLVEVYGAGLVERCRAVVIQGLEAVAFQFHTRRVGNGMRDNLKSLGQGVERFHQSRHCFRTRKVDATRLA